MNLQQVVDLQEALRKWFYTRASVPHHKYGMDEKATAELKGHLAGCSIIWADAPDFGSIEQSGEYHDRTVCGIEALVRCGCGRFGYTQLFMTHTTSLTSVLAQVIAAAGKDS